MSDEIKLKSKNIVNYHVANDIGSFVAKNSNFNEMNAPQDKYLSMLAEYYNNPILKVSSTIRMDKLEAFNTWLPEALDNINKVIPYLVSNMFKGDIFSLNMYDNLCEYGNLQDLIINYDKIHTDPVLKETFMQYGGAEDGRAILSAEHWLESSSAAEIFKSSNDLEILCAVNSMSHINNEHITC